jgi:hypothetical protein
MGYPVTRAKMTYSRNCYTKSYILTLNNRRHYSLLSSKLTNLNPASTQEPLSAKSRV